MGEPIQMPFGNRLIWVQGTMGVKIGRIHSQPRGVTSWSFAKLLWIKVTICLGTCGTGFPGQMSLLSLTDNVDAPK